MGDESNFFPPLSLEGISLASENRQCHTVHGRNANAMELSVYWQEGNWTSVQNTEQNNSAG